MFKSTRSQIGRRLLWPTRAGWFGRTAFTTGFFAAAGIGIWTVVGGAAPPPPPAGLSAVAQLGQALFAEGNLSNPKGMSCLTCHAPQAGWAYPGSDVNLLLGPVPGAVKGRYGNRRPPTIGYASLMKNGPPALVQGIYVGGFFYDGRAATLTDQIYGPLQNPNEMNNTQAGVVAAVAAGPEAALFKKAYGVAITKLPVDEAFLDVAEALAAYENTARFSPFNSKYDAYLAGQASLAPAELAGLQLFTGSTTGRPGGPATLKQAGCVMCHAIPADAGDGPDLFTFSGFFNIGTPKNPDNPYYTLTNAKADPLGYNPLGAAYIDYGLGDFLYTQLGLPAGNTGAGSNGQGDYLAINGLFKTPTLRNVDTRPTPDFVKDYGHNGYFKTLAGVVHFHSTRNLTTVPGEVIDFTQPNPYAGLKGTPLWPPPEYPSPATLVNPAGAPGGLIGNLGLSAADEANLVAFLKTLSDGTAAAPAATAPPAPAPPPPPPAPPAPPPPSPPPAR